MITEKIEFHKHRDLGDRINITFKFIKQNGKQIARTFLYFIPIYIIASIAVSMSQGAIYSEAYYGYSSGSNLGITYIFSSLANLVVSLASFVALLYVVSFVTEYEESKDGVVDNQQVWDRVKKSFWGAVGGSLIAGIAIFVGIMFCLIPGIWVGVSFSLFIAAYVAERKKEVSGTVSDCLVESFNLVKQDWFGSFAYLFVISIIALAFYVALYVPALFTTVMGGLSHSDYIVQVLIGTVSYTVYYIGALFLSTLTSVATTALYYDLKERASGFSLQKKIDSIGQQEDSDDNFNQFS